MFYAMVLYLDLLMEGCRLSIAHSRVLAKVSKGFSLSCKLSPMARCLHAVHASAATLSNNVSLLNLH